MKFLDSTDDKALVVLMGAQYLLSGTKAIMEALAPMLTAAQIAVAVVTVIWIWRRAQGQRLENHRLSGNITEQKIENKRLTGNLRRSENRRAQERRKK